MDNNSPVIDAASVTGGSAYEPDDGAAADSRADGTIFFTDADPQDVHSATIAGVSTAGVTSGLPDEAALLALLTTDPLVEPAASQPGALAWHFSATDAAFDYLAAGEVVTLTYTVEIADGQGGTADQDIVITVTGRNDAPVIGAGSATDGAVHEPNFGPDGSADGAILFTDADLSDVHSAAVTGVSAAGVTAGLPAEAALRALLTMDALAEPAAGATGTLGWHFTATDAAFDYLAAGEVVTLTYAVEIADGQGGTADRDIVVTVTGRNDAPMIAIASVASGAVHEPDGIAAADSKADGTILFTDADLSDLHVATVASVSAAGVTAGLPDEAALRALLTTDALVEPAAGASGALGWHFNATDAAFDYLAAGEVVTLTYAVEIADGQGGAADQNIVITVTGRDDAPVVGAGSVTDGAAYEPNGVATDGNADGAILFTDAELADLHSATVTGVSVSGATTGLPDDTALLALLTTDPLVEPAGASPGTLDWHFAATDAAFDYLSAGETVTLGYAVKIADSEGGETVQDVNVTVTGRNDAPVIDPASTTGGTVHEADGGVAPDSATGTILFTDPDLSDVHSVTVGGVSASGVTAGLPDDAALLALLTMDPVAEPANGQPGSLGWRFTAAEGAFDYLAAGEAVTLTYAVKLADGQGGEADRNVTVTVEGRNDAPAIEAASTAEGLVHESNGTTISGDSAAGTLLFTDADRSDTHHVTVTGVSASGVTSGLPNTAALLSLLTTDPLTEPASGAPGALDWHFDGSPGLFDYLKTGETARLTYTVEISDGQGGTTSQDIVIDAGQVITSYDYSYSFGDGASPWTSWMTNAVVHDGSDPQHPDYTRFTLPGAIDPNHVDGIGPLWLLSHLGAAAVGSAGAMDLRGAEVDITIRGENFDPNGAALYIWICSYLPSGEPLDNFYPGIQITNWCFTGQNLSGLVTSDWSTIKVKLDANPADWTYAGNNITGQGDWANRYAPMDLNDALANVNATLHVMLLGTDANHPPSGLIDIENITVQTATPAVPILPPSQLVHGLENHDVSGAVDGADPTGQAGLQFSVVPASEQHGTVVLDAQTGAFTFTPDQSFFGLTDTESPASFDYVVSDGTSQSSAQRVYLDIAPVAPVPDTYAGSEDVEIDGDQPFNFYLMKGEDANGSQLTFAVDQASVHGGQLSLDAATGRYTFVPDPGFLGQAGFAYTVSNGVEQSAAKTVTLTVDPPDTPPPVLSTQDVFQHYQDSGDVFAFARDMKSLADHGDANAAYQLGISLVSGGRGLTPDWAAAAHYFGLSVGTVPDGSVQLATLYLAGEGVDQDYAAANALLHGVESLPQAQYLLGLTASQGFGTPLDLQAAAEHFLHAASQGQLDAMYTLGRRYLSGEGVEVNPTAAYFWLESTLKLDNGAFLPQVEQLFRYDAGLAAAQLSTDDIASIDAAVALWHPGLPTPYEAQDDYSINYASAGSFAGVGYLSYTDTYEFSGVRTKRAYFDGQGTEVASQAFTFDGGYVIDVHGSPTESYSIFSDGSYELRYYLAGNVLGQAYQSYINHYGTDGSHDQSFLDSGGQVVASLSFSANGDYLISVAGAPEEQRIMDGGGGYSLHYVTGGTYLGESYQSYSNHYAPSGFRDEQLFYAADGHTVIDYSYAPDGGYLLSLDGAPREQRSYESDGSYSIHFFLGGSFLGQDYASYTNHYSLDGSRDQTLFAGDGSVAASQSFDADGGYQLSIGGVAQQERIMDGDGGYSFRYFTSGTFLGEDYQSYANHYGADGFRDEQLFYAADGHTVIDYSYTPDGGYLLSLEGVSREQRSYESDGSYSIHFFLGGSFFGQDYASYTNHYGLDGSREQTLFAGDGSVAASQSFGADGGYQLSIRGVVQEERVMDGAGGYFFQEFTSGNFLGEDYQSYANHYRSDGFADQKLFYAADGHVAAAESFSPDGGYSIALEGVVSNAKTMIANGAYDLYYHFSGLPYSAEDDIYRATDERIEQTLRYDNGDLHMILSSPGNEVDVGDTVSFRFDGIDYALGSAQSLFVDARGTRSDIAVHNESHDLVISGFVPSAGSRVLAQDVFTDFNDVMAHASQQGGDVVLNLGAHAITLVGVQLSDLSQATFGFG